MSLNRLDLNNLGHPVILESTKFHEGYPRLYLDYKGTDDGKPIGLIFSQTIRDGERWRDDEAVLATQVMRGGLHQAWLNQFLEEVQKIEKTPFSNSFMFCSRKHADYSAGENYWKIDWVGTWAAEGISFSKKDDKEQKVRVAIETPPLAWQAGCASMIEEDKAISQLGPFIVLYDLNNMEIFLLGIGTNPIVIAEK